MDVIKFKLSDKEKEGWRVITIINGTKINEFVHENGRKAGDRYGDGIYPGWLYFELKGGHYYTSGVAQPYFPWVPNGGFSGLTGGSYYTCNSGDKAETKEERKAAGVLGCACGADGCGQYIVRITETENSVIWDDDYAIRYNQPSCFHFEFDKKQYFEEVEKLIDLTLQIGAKEGLPVDLLNDLENRRREIESADYFEEQFYGQKKHFKFY